MSIFEAMKKKLFGLLLKFSLLSQSSSAASWSGCCCKGLIKVTLLTRCISESKFRNNPIFWWHCELVLHLRIYVAEGSDCIEDFFSSIKLLPVVPNELVKIILTLPQITESICAPPMCAPPVYHPGANPPIGPQLANKYPNYTILLLLNFGEWFSVRYLWNWVRGQITECYYFT